MSPDDRKIVERHRPEFSFMFGQYMVQHLVRLRHKFDGDIEAAIVLGTIAQYNTERLFLELVSRTGETLEQIFQRGAHEPYLRTCNAMSVAESTGIPRETVRRKIRWLIKKGYVEQRGRDKLVIFPGISAKFADFDEESLDRLMILMERFREVLDKRADPKESDALSVRSPSRD